jgi:hypothetical protein
MAQSESSYSDRLQRARQIQAAIEGFLPPFAPADSSLAGTVFVAFLDNAEAANLAIASKLADWKDTVSTRSNLLSNIKARVLRASARVKSNPNWAKHVPAVKALADKLRGYRTTTPKPPTENGTEPKAAREKGDQSYADIKNQLDLFNAALKKISGFDTNAPVDITIASLVAVSSQFLALNSLIASNVQALSATRSARLALYDGAEGLSAKLKAIKESAKSQYGTNSSQYNQIKPIRI